MSPADLFIPEVPGSLTSCSYRWLPQNAKPPIYRLLLTAWPKGSWVRLNVQVRKSDLCNWLLSMLTRDRYATMYMSFLHVKQTGQN